MSLRPVVLLGHVDHGKSSVFRALGAGRASLRENARGNTIDFSVVHRGVAPEEVAIVDVPGHRDYRASTFAAIAGAGTFALVVAADEGLAAQSWDHFHFAHAAGLRKGLVVWTKTDRVDASTLARRCDETAEKLGAFASVETFVLGDARAPESAVLLALERLLVRLAQSAAVSDPLPQRGHLWIDRTFVSRSGGRVVTGTWQGSEPLGKGATLAGGDGDEWRVRGMERAGVAITEAMPGMRLALAISGEGHLGRGVRLVRETSPVGVTRADVCADASEPYRSGKSYEVWFGTGHTLAEVEGVRDGVVRFRFGRPVPLAVGDRLVVRDGGGERTVGYAFVIDPAPVGAFRRLVKAGTSDPAEEFVRRRSVVDARDIAKHTLWLDDAPRVSSERLEEARLAWENELTASASPRRVRELAKLPAVRVLGEFGTARLLVLLRSRSGLRCSDGWWWCEAHEDASSPWWEVVGRILAHVEAEDLDREKLSARGRDALAWLLDTEQVVDVAEGEYWLRSRWDAFVGRVRGAFLGPDVVLSLGTLRERLGLSRREAVRYLEALDRRGLTERSDDGRRFRSIPNKLSDRLTFCDRVPSPG